MPHATLRPPYLMQTKIPPLSAAARDERCATGGARRGPYTRSGAGDVTRRAEPISFIAWLGVIGVLVSNREVVEIDNSCEANVRCRPMKVAKCRAHETEKAEVVLR